jgi:ubiquilin
MPGMGGMPGMAGMMGGMGGMPGMPGMGGDMPGQMPMGMNPDMIANIMGNPMIQGMMNDLFSDPSKMKDLFENNPMLSQMAEGNDHLKDLMENPDKLKDAMTPDKIETSIKEMQASMGGQAPVASADGTGATGSDLPPIGTTGGAPAGMPNLEQMMGNFDPSMINDMMSGFNLAGAGAAGGVPAASAGSDFNSMSNDELKTTFSSQLEQMANMGFPNESANIETLKQTNGDVDTAIEKSLEKMSQ